MEALGCASCVLNSMRWRTPGVLLNAWVDGHMNFFSSIRCQHSSWQFDTCSRRGLRHEPLAQEKVKLCVPSYCRRSVCACCLSHAC